MIDAKARPSMVRIKAFSDGVIVIIVVVAIMLINPRALMRLPSYAMPSLYWWSAHLLFWTSLIALTIAMARQNPFGPLAVGFCGAIMCATSLGFMMLQRCVFHLATKQRTTAVVAKDLISTLLYAATIPLGILSVFISDAIYVAVSAPYFMQTFDNSPHRNQKFTARKV